MARQTAYEIRLQLATPLMPALHQEIRSRLQELVNSSDGPKMKLLDVGGRKSPYTVGIRAIVTISDLARESDMQNRLNLGITSELAAELTTVRSNIEAVVIDDMSRSELASATYDGVVAVEVLEHVDEDDAFVENVARVMKPKGFFLMTTPNGDSRPIPHQDHRRHYQRAQLVELLGRHFCDVKVDYAVVLGKWRSWGLRSLSPGKPVQTGLAIVGNVVSRAQSRQVGLSERPTGTANLLAICRIPRAGL